MANVGKMYRNGQMDVRVGGRYARLLLPPDDPNYLSVEDLDTEELARGQLKDKNGEFRGRPPKFLPREIFDAMRKEHYARVNAELEAALSPAVKVMRSIALDPTEDGGTRLKAAIYVYERFMGKIPDRVEVAPQAKVQQVVDQILYDVEQAEELAEAAKEQGDTRAARQPSAVEAEIAATQDELEQAPSRSNRRRAARRTPQRRREGS